MTWQVGDIALDPDGHRYEVTWVGDGRDECKELVDTYDDCYRRFKLYRGPIHPAWKKEEAKNG